jgi:hypothetical protein
VNKTLPENDFHLVCDGCGDDNGLVSAVRKTKLGYVPVPCLCGHSIFRLLTATQLEERQAADQQLSLALS